MFSKEERLCSRLLIEKLFNGDRSKSVMSFPLRAIFMTEERDDSCVRAKILVSVPIRALSSQPILRRGTWLPASERQPSQAEKM